MTDSSRRRAKKPAPALFPLLRWLLALGTGAAVYCWVTPSPIPTIVAAWYVFESAQWIVSCFGPNGLAVALVYLLPRATCTALVLALVYLIGLPWSPIIALTFATTAILEGICRLLIRLIHPTTLSRAQAALDAVAWHPVDRAVRMRAGRVAGAALCALLLVLG
jgi:hypothetical protein